MTAWLNAFLLTQLVEIPVYLAFSRQLPVRKRLIYAVGASLITHPIVWLIVLSDRAPYGVLITIAELLAFVAEAMLGVVLGVRRPWIASLTANSASILIGLATRSLFGWP